MVRCRRINILFFFYTIFLLLFYSHCHFDLGSFNILMFIYRSYMYMMMISWILRILGMLREVAIFLYVIVVCLFVAYDLHTCKKYSC